MKINILLPYKEKFDDFKASSVSITVKNNMNHSKFFKNIRVFGKETNNPFFPKNFIGIKYPFWILKSKNKFLADQLIKEVLKSKEQQLIEIHNRPYLVDRIKNKVRLHPITLFLHNDPKEMNGSKSILERKKLLIQCEAIICVSEYIKNHFIDGLKNNINKVFVLHNGVEREIKKFPVKKKEVLFVGRLVADKGVDLYVDAVNSVAFKFPDWNFNLIGSSKLGEVDKKNSYAYKVSKKFQNIGSQAKFHGFKDNEFVKKQMKDASIIIIPSLWDEPFGLVVAEAKSFGIAIIASEKGGIPEIVKKSGILIKNINHQKIEKSLVELLISDEKRNCLQKKSWKNFQHSSLKSSTKLDTIRKMIFKNFY